MSGRHLKVNPEVVIRGVPMVVTGMVEDKHGVSWVNVEPAKTRSARIRKNIQQAALRINMAED